MNRTVRYREIGQVKDMNGNWIEINGEKVVTWTFEPHHDPQNPGACETCGIGVLENNAADTPSFRGWDDESGVEFLLCAKHTQEIIDFYTNLHPDLNA